MKQANKLTPKQEAFCLAYIKTGNASKAYRQAYEATQMSAAAVEVEASRLLNHPKVTLRLARVQEKEEVKALLSLEEHMRELRGLRDRAVALGKMSAAIRAEQLRGQLRRFYVKQVESGGSGEFADWSDEELEAFIKSPMPRPDRKAKH